MVFIRHFARRMKAIGLLMGVSFAVKSISPKDDLHTMLYLPKILANVLQSLDFVINKFDWLNNTSNVLHLCINAIALLSVDSSSRVEHIISFVFKL